MAQVNEEGQSTETTTYGQVTGGGMDRMYTTKDGDTLEDIASFFYGDPSHKQRLLDDNPELTPDTPLPPGMRIRVPLDPSRGDQGAET